MVERLQGVRATGPRRWIAKCPVHENRSPSLSIRELDDGRVLLHDFGGCATSDVVTSVGLQFRDLFPEHTGPQEFKPSRQWVHARDVLACLATEGQILALVANDIANGRPISPADAARVTQACGRIRNAWGLTNGRH